MLKKFCGNFSMNSFEGDSPGACFLQLYFFFPFCCLYFLATLIFSVVHWKYAAFNCPHRNIYWFRLSIASAILCSSLAALLLSYLLPLFHSSFFINGAFEVVHYATTMILWIALLIYDYYHGKSILYSSRGPVIHLLFSIAYFYLSVAVLWSIIRQAVNPWRIYSITFRAIHVILVGLHLLSKVPLIFTVDESQQRSVRNDYERLDPTDRSLSQVTPSRSSEDKASYFSRAFFNWMSPTVKAGYRGELTEVSHLPDLPLRLDTVAMEARLPMVDEGTPHSNYLFLKVIFKVFGVEFLTLSALKFMLSVANLCAPIFLNQFILSLSVENLHMRYSVAWGVPVILVTFVASLLGTNYDYRMSTLGFKIRVSVTGLVYRSLLTVPLASLNKLGTGSLINYLTVDADRIVNLANSLQEVWAMPLQLILSIVLLYQQLGVSSLVGVAFLLVLLPLNRLLAVQIAKYSTQLMQSKDARIKLISEVLSNMAAVKVSCWERLMQSRITQSRSKELKALWGQKMLDAICVFFWAACPAVLASSTFATFSTIGNELNAAVVFTSLALFNMLIGPMNALPWVINGIMEALVSVRRIGCLLSLPRSSFNRVDSTENEDPIGSGTVLYPSAIRLEGATFHWGDSESPVLSDISIDIASGQLIGVTGPVGSGKSALLLSILGELIPSKLDGNTDRPMGVRPKYAYVGQTPWLFSGTIRDNILFGSTFDPNWMMQVVHACALETDLAALPSGLDTDVGESGGSRLSGGQRARVALARAVYQKADVYLLDDPLSALDVHVAEHIVKHCFVGLLAKKTRVVTSSSRNSWFVRKEADAECCLADVILELANGRIVGQFTNTTHNRPVADPGDDIPLLSVSSGDKHTADIDEPLALDDTTPDPNNPTASSLTLPETDESLDVEQSATGTINAQVYRYYIRSMGYCLGIGVLLSLLFMQASRNAADLWLAHWVQSSSPAPSPNASRTFHRFVSFTEPFYYYYGLFRSPTDSWHELIPARHTFSDSFYLSVYGGIVAGHVVVTTFRAFLFALSGLAAAAVVHRRALETTLQACIEYFDRTPQGRILNRFSADVGTIDDGLPFILNILLANIVGLLGVTIVTCVALPSLIVILMPLIFVFWSVQRLYRGAARDLKRISSVSRSPVYAHFVDTLAGLAVIRGHGKQTCFREVTASNLGVQLRAELASLAAGCWLSIRLQLISTGVVAGVICLSLTGRTFNWIEIPTVGLSVAYALSIASLMTGTVYVATETEKNFIAVERCQELTEDTPIEMKTVPVTTTAPVPRNFYRDSGLLQSDTELLCPNLPRDWPLGCRIEFRNVSLAYQRAHRSSESLHVLALNNISFMVECGERLGIVGRTGSGKSSILRVLLRLVEHLPGKYTNLDLAQRRGFNGASGLVLIDGVDIRTVPLSTLRSSILTVIQEPFLFSGTLRANLDPSGLLSDVRLCEVLLKCRLASTNEEAQQWLKREVGEAGRDISAGQRQLICLARALLRDPKPRIVCLDEATAAVDDTSEELIHAVLDSEFRNSTVLLIAHRLSTVVRFCPRVLVMHAGRIVADGDASSLLEGDSIPLPSNSSDLIQF